MPNSSFAQTGPMEKRSRSPSRAPGPRRARPGCWRELRRPSHRRGTGSLRPCEAGPPRPRTPVEHVGSLVDHVEADRIGLGTKRRLHRLPTSSQPPPRCRRRRTTPRPTTRQSSATTARQSGSNAGRDGRRRLERAAAYRHPRRVGTQQREGAAPARLLDELRHHRGRECRSRPAGPRAPRAAARSPRSRRRPRGHGRGRGSPARRSIVRAVTSSPLSRVAS